MATTMAALARATLVKMAIKRVVLANDITQTALAGNGVKYASWSGVSKRSYATLHQSVVFWGFQDGSVMRCILTDRTEYVEGTEGEYARSQYDKEPYHVRFRKLITAYSCN